MLQPSSSARLHSVSEPSAGCPQSSHFCTLTGRHIVDMIALRSSDSQRVEKHLGCNDSVVHLPQALRPILRREAEQRQLPCPAHQPALETRRRHTTWPLVCRLPRSAVHRQSSRCGSLCGADTRRRARVWSSTWTSLPLALPPSADAPPDAVASSGAAGSGCSLPSPGAPAASRLPLPDGIASVPVLLSCVSRSVWSRLSAASPGVPVPGAGGQSTAVSTRLALVCSRPVMSCTTNESS